MKQYLQHNVLIIAIVALVAIVAIFSILPPNSMTAVSYNQQELTMNDKDLHQGENTVENIPEKYNLLGEATVKPRTYLKCIDSDGKNFGNKGSVEWEYQYNGRTYPGTFEDRCRNTYQLTEGYCNGKISATMQRVCSCSDGACVSETAQGVSCADNDPQDDPYTAAQVCLTTPDGVACQIDSCKGFSVLNERFCDGQNMGYKDIDCPNGCANGACRAENLPQQIFPQCTDTDNGKKYAVKGTTTYTFGEKINLFEDGCSIEGKPRLIERYCNGIFPQNEEYVCPIVCWLGKCLSSRPVCTESDPGAEEAFTQGVTQLWDENRAVVDSCIDQNTLMEHACSADAFQYIPKTISCEFGCEQGVCRKEPIMIRYAFSGEVIAMNDPLNILGGLIKKKQSASVLIEYQAQNQDTDSDQMLGIYTYPGDLNRKMKLSVSFADQNAGTRTVASSLIPEASVQITNSPTKDSFTVESMKNSAQNGLEGKVTVNRMLLQLVDNTASAFTTDELPMVIDGSQFPQSDLQILFTALNNPSRTATLLIKINGIKPTCAETDGGFNPTMGGTICSQNAVGSSCNKDSACDTIDKNILVESYCTPYEAKTTKVLCQNSCVSDAISGARCA